MQLVHGVEIVNGDAADGIMAGWTFWASQLNEGRRLVAVGGSDEHTPDETADRRIGTPATVVFAPELSEAGILDGLKRGRAYVRTRGPGGPAIEFEARAAGRRAQMGDAIPAGQPVTLSVEASGDRAGTVSWVRRGEIVQTAGLDAAGRAELTVSPRRGDWFSVILADACGPTAFSSAIYVE
jgi:hypothetical protein